MVSSNNNRCEVRSDDSMPEVTNEPNRHIAHPRKAIDDSVKRSGSTTEHSGGASGAQRCNGGVSAYMHPLSVISMDFIDRPDGTRLTIEIAAFEEDRNASLVRYRDASHSQTRSLRPRRRF